MARAINAIIDHWRSTRGKRHSTVAFAQDGAQPGAGGLEIHWGPWTIGEQDRVFGTFDMHVEAGGLKMRPAAFARILCVKAEDRDGKRLFADLEEEELLREANPREVQRVATLMMASLAADNAAGRGDEDGGSDPKAQTSAPGSGAST